MPIKLANNASGQIATGLAPYDIGLALVAGQGATFPSLAAGEYFYATLASAGGSIEIVKVTAKVNDTFTIVRAQEGTTALSFSAGARFELRVTAQSVRDAIDDVTASAVGFTPTGGLAATDVQAAIVEVVTDLAASGGAAAIGFTPTGGIAASTVQSALTELDTEKVGFTRLDDSDGSSLVGYTQGGTGASTRTVQAKLRDAVSVKDFGAVGDGVTNDTAAIQAALNSGAKCVCVPAGTYRIGSQLSVPSNVTVEGDGAGSVIKPLDSSGDAASPILSLRNVENVVVRDIVLDGNVTNLTATFGHCGAWLSGARGCLFERVVFQDIGQSATTYAGVHCNVTAYETGDAQATAFDITGVSTEKCVWRDCLFKDADAKASFGLRLYTNFDNPIADNAFTKEVRDCQIINCQFTGFAFNSVELAGPGVHSNLVSGCVFDGHRGYGTIDIDKGATDNEAVDCSIRNVLAKKLNNAEVAVASPIARIQGYDNGAGIVRYSRRNAIRNLHIDGLGQMVSNSFAVLMDYAYDCEVSGGYWNVSIASGISSGGKFGTRVKNCIFRDVSVVGLTGNGDAFSNRSYTTITEDCTDNAVINCRAACSYNGVWFENTGSFVSSNIEVRACYFTGVTNAAVKFVKQVDALAVENVVVAPTGAAYAMHADNCTRPRFSQNTIRKPSTDGIQVDANCTEAVLDSNVITEVQSGGWLGIHDLATATHVVGNYIQRVQNSDIRGRKETWGSAAPTAGSWKIGDVVYNTAPAAGNFVGWICVTTGTPGTWKTFGAISV